MPDYYALLGIFRDATQEEIKRAYFEAAQRLHPDKNEAPGETEIFLDVQQAYDVLSNPEKRIEYDKTLSPEEKILSPIVQRVFYSRESLVRLGETQLIYALLEWKARKNDDEVVSPPLNICLVLDNSTSMKGQNIEMVKAAAIHLMRSLRPQDIFSVVTFSDRAEVLIPASLQSEPRRMETKIRMLVPSGGTEILQGLQTGLNEVRRNLSSERVNHIVLLTDGQTYGDEEETLALADEAESMGVGISGLGVGKDWNDEFLDKLAEKTGSSSRYIAEPQEIRVFLEEKFRQLAKVFAENLTLELQTPPQVELSYIFRLQPNAAHLSFEKKIQLGMILRDQPLGLLLEFQVHPDVVIKDEVELLAGTLKFEIPSQSSLSQPMRVRISRNVTEVASLEPPSPTLVHALANLNLYRMQETAQEEAAQGKYNEASRRLQHLATHLLSHGERSMAKTVLLEAENLQQEESFSEEGRKNMKYGTRALLLPAGKGKES
ncbi:MAG: VWA domain-containing protein [Anaerolineae bacterium]|nr:VWA domain-containing protein [Anaerolineae bacterium]MBT7191018.1 VWA domain-containing protein [Anaerolineae bacterium]